MTGMDSAPRDGRYVACFCGGEVVTFAYFEDGRWLAPQMIGRPDLGVSEINPTSWQDLPTPLGS